MNNYQHPSVNVINSILCYKCCKCNGQVRLGNGVGCDSSVRYECFWKGEQCRYRARLPTCAFRRVVLIGNLKIDVACYYIYPWTLVIMNNYIIIQN
jgi:hypothetical protein